MKIFGLSIALSVTACAVMMKEDAETKNTRLVATVLQLGPAEDHFRHTYQLLAYFPGEQALKPRTHVTTRHREATLFTWTQQPRHYQFILRRSKSLLFPKGADGTAPCSMGRQAAGMSFLGR